MKPTFRRLAALAGSAALALVVVGTATAATPAKLTAVVATDATGTPDAGTAWIRVLHASPDAPAVDVYVDGTKAITALAFGQVAPSTAPGYVPVPAGNHAVKVCATGSTTVCPIDVPALAVADGKKYTIAATNALSKIQAQVLEDAPAAGAEGALVRVVHLSADTPAVDVYVNGTKAVTDLAYPKATDYLALPGGDYAVKVCATGSTTVCPIDVPKLTVANGTAYSVFAVGSLSAATATPEPAASPMATPPPTDTAAPATGSPNGAPFAALAAIAAVALASITLTGRLAARRSRS